MTSTASTTVSQVALMSAVELAANIRDRSISCHEVMVAYLDQIDAHNPKVNAIVSRVDRETLLAAATASKRPIQGLDAWLAARCEGHGLHSGYSNHFGVAAV